MTTALYGLPNKRFRAWRETLQPLEQFAPTPGAFAKEVLSQLLATFLLNAGLSAKNGTF